MSKQKAVGYIRASRGDNASLEEQRMRIVEYCKKQGYELVDHFETNRTLDGNQLDRLWEFIREQLGITKEPVRLITATLSRIGKSLDVTRSMMISLQSMGIDLEPIDVGGQNRVALWRSMQDPFPKLTGRIHERMEKDGPVKRISCSFCGGTGENYHGCSCSAVELDGKFYKRIPFGSEKKPSDLPFCPDCGALTGRFHHSHCEIDQCPACGKSIYACNCQMAFILEGPEVGEEEFDILKVAEAVFSACETDQSDGKKAEVRKYVTENYDPDMTSEENAALIAVMYLSEAKCARIAAGKAHAKTSGRSDQHKKGRKSK